MQAYFNFTKIKKGCGGLQIKQQYKRKDQGFKLKTKLERKMDKITQNSKIKKCGS